MAKSAARPAQVPVTARFRTVALLGLEPAPVEVEVMAAPGLPGFSIVGLPDKAVAESKERVRGALASLALALPLKRITVNLAPGDLAKEGSHYDLPIALGLLVVMGVLPHDAAPDAIALGELGLDGALRPVAGVLAAALAAAAEKLALICPAANGPEAAWLKDEVEITAPATLLDLIAHLQGERVLAQPDVLPFDDIEPGFDLADVKGQESAKRALEIAAAGGHNLLMQGPPGSGKSMLAKRMAALLPPLTPAEVLEVGLIQSIGGRLNAGRLSRRRPFRSPHHASSTAAMVGGGANARPGEISLSHRGVLFLDELPEFPRHVLEALRQPLEDGRVTIARANAHVTYPARIQLVAAMNPCRCGHLDDPGLACTKAPRCAADYQKRLSGPLLDRIDIHIDVPALTPRELALPAASEPGEVIAARVAAARELQAARLAALDRLDLKTNAEAEGELLDRIAPLGAGASELLTRATGRLRLSARGYYRILRVARTIADLAGSVSIEKAHLAEAIAYRRRPIGG